MYNDIRHKYERGVNLLFKNINIVDENFDIIEDGFLQIEGDKIVYIGKDRPEGYSGETYNGKNKLAVPGFFNTHCHIPMTLLRGYGEGLPLDRWLFEKVFPFEAKLQGEDCYWATLLGAMELIKSGVVSFNDMYFYIENMIEAVEESGLKINICHGTSPAEGKTFFQLPGVQDTERMMKKYNSQKGKILVDMGIHAEYTSNEEFVREVAAFAKENNLIVHTHISETKNEHEECKIRHGLTPVEYFEKCGLLDNKVVGAHCVYVEDGDLDILKAKGVSPVHCISSNMKLGSGFAPTKKILNKGINLTLGTDGPSSNNNLNFMEEIHLAAMVNKGYYHDPEFMSPKEILKIATLNGAKAQGRESCGSLKVGNQADFFLVDFNQAHLQPVFDYLSNLVYSAQATDICLTLIDGEIVYKEGEFINIDEEKVIFETNRCRNRILSEL